MSCPSQCYHGYCDTGVCICDTDWSGAQCDIQWYSTSSGVNAYLAYRITFITIWCCLLLFGLHRLWVLSRSRYRKAVAVAIAATTGAAAAGHHRHVSPNQARTAGAPGGAIAIANDKMGAVNKAGAPPQLAPLPVPLRIAIGTNNNTAAISIMSPPAMYTYQPTTSLPHHHHQHSGGGHNVNVRHVIVVPPTTIMNSAPLSPTPQPGTGMNSSAGLGTGSARNALMSPPMSSPFSPFSPLGSPDGINTGIGGSAGSGGAVTSGIPGAVTLHRSSEETLTTPAAAHGTPTQQVLHANAAALSLPLALAPPIISSQHTPTHQPLNSGRSGLLTGGANTPHTGPITILAAPPPPPIAPAPPITPSNAQLGHMGQQVAPSLAHLSSIPQLSPQHAQQQQHAPLLLLPPSVAANAASNAANAAAIAAAVAASGLTPKRTHRTSSASSHRRTVGARWRIRQCLSDMQIVSLIVSSVSCLLLIVAFIDPREYPHVYHGFIALGFTLVVMVCVFVLRAFTSSIPTGRSHIRQQRQIKAVYIFACIAFVIEIGLSIICLAIDPEWSLTALGCVLSTHVLVIVIALTIYQSTILVPLLSGRYAPRATSITAYRQRGSALFFSRAITSTKISATTTIIAAFIIISVNNGNIEGSGETGMIEQFVFFFLTALVHLCIVIIVGRAPKSRARHSLVTGNAATAAAIIAATRQLDYQAPFAGNSGDNQPLQVLAGNGGGNTGGGTGHHHHRHHHDAAATALLAAQQQQRHARERQQVPPGGGASSNDSGPLSPGLPNVAQAYLVNNTQQLGGVAGQHAQSHGPPSPNGNSSGDSVRDPRSGGGNGNGNGGGSGAATHGPIVAMNSGIMSPVQHSGFLAPNMARVRGAPAQSLIVMDSQMASFIDHLGVSEALSRNDGPPRPFAGSTGGMVHGGHGNGGSPMHSSLSPQYVHRPRGYTDSDRRRPFLPGGGGGGGGNGNGGHNSGYGAYGNNGGGGGAATDNNTSSVPDDEGDTMIIPPNAPAKSSGLATTATLAAEMPPNDNNNNNNNNVITLPNGPSASLLSLPPPAAALSPSHHHQRQASDDDHDHDDSTGRGLMMLTTVAVTPIDTMSSPAHMDHHYPYVSQPPNMGGVSTRGHNGALTLPTLGTGVSGGSSGDVTNTSTTPIDPLSRFGSPVHGLVGSSAGSPFGSGLPSPYNAAIGTNTGSSQRSMIGTSLPSTNPATIITLLTGVSSGSGAHASSSGETAAAMSPSGMHEQRSTRTLSAASAAATSSEGSGAYHIHTNATGYGGMSPITHRGSLPARMGGSIGSIGSIAPVGSIGAMMSNGMIVGENSPVGMATGRSIASGLGLYQSQPGTIDERYVLNMNAITTPSAAFSSNSVAVNHAPYMHTMSSIHTYTSSHTTGTHNNTSSPIPLTPSQLAASLPGHIFSPIEPLE